MAGRGRGDAAKGTGKKRYRSRFLFRRRKYCKLCESKVCHIDYKDSKLMGSYTPERSKILPRRISGTCAMHQRMLCVAIKRARHLALLPFTTD